MLKYSPASYFISPILLQLLGAIKPLSYSKWNEGNLILPGSRPHTLVRWCGLVTVGALRRALPCSSSGTWLEEWLPFSCSSSGTWFWGITALLLQLWYLTGGVTSSLLLHLCFPAHLSALKDCGLCGGYVESCLEASPDPKNTETNKNPSTFKSYCLSNIG